MVKFSFFSNLKELQLKVKGIKSEFVEMNDSLNFIKKITVILSVLLITSTIFIIAKGE